MPFRDHLRAAREAAGLSQSALAKLSGVSQSAISAIEKDERSPSEETMQLLANALGRCVSDMTVELESDADYTEKAAQRELDGQVDEFIRRASQLTPENQRKALSYMEFLFEREQARQAPHDAQPVTAP